MTLEVLPLAITTIAGPQIISAVILTTTRAPYRLSGMFLAGFMVSVLAGTAAAYGLAQLLDFGGTGHLQSRGSTGRIIQYVLVGLLVVLAVKNYLGRRTAEPPKWLGALLTASPAKAFRVGLLLALLMPSDLLVMLTVGISLRSDPDGYWGGLPFFGAVLLLIALPLITFTVFRRRMATAMPRVRDWLNSHSWLVNIFCCVIFILIILGGT
ncbi:GAP family protein [Streptomyces sp. WMMB 322]|uniref:GAP family protein n=1 Tax=Streptomyces sp. WMMB 322 TaxID=1286821 RepID=UPI0006E34D87|nr:GAP family protein [Streptomyces sp. WMMB 322]SCK29445.1 Sap, sulfolipid-1-addressing protein [Streptomyces sp. WMMB 322]